MTWRRLFCPWRCRLRPVDQQVIDPGDSIPATIAFCTAQAFDAQLEQRCPACGRYGLDSMPVDVRPVPPFHHF